VFRPLAILFAAASLAATSPAPDIAAAIRKGELDPNLCFRVRDLHFSREDLRFYLSNGHLIFGKPVNGRIISAVFSAEIEGGEAEVLLLPPTRGERISLASFTGSPNLTERFIASVMIFTDDTAEVLRKAVEARGAERSAERGLLLASTYNSVVSNLSASFTIRLVDHLLSGKPELGHGLFYAAIRGHRLNNFDVFHDPEAADQIYLGQLNYRDNRAFYDTWTSFPSRPFRTGAKPVLTADCQLDNFRIEAVLDDALAMRAVTRFTLTPTRPALRVINLDISSRMQVTAARINGAETEVFTRESLRANLVRRNESVLFLLLPAEPLEIDRAYEVEIEHEGNVVLTAGPNVYFVGARANWHPRAGFQFARFDITFSYPARLEMLFPGELKSDETAGGVRTTRRVTAAPIRMAGFNLGNYVMAKHSSGPLSVEVYANKELEPALKRRPEVVVLPPPPAPFPRRGPPPVIRRPEVMHIPQDPVDPSSNIESLAAEIGSAFEFLSSHFGPPATNTLKVSPIPGTFGQGFPGLVYLSTLAYLDPRDRPAFSRSTDQQLFFSELLPAHETAHQWFGNVVTSASPQDDWLMEALANYSSLLVLEKKKGPRALQEALEQYRAQLLDKGEDGRLIESAGPIRLGGRLQSSHSPTAWHKIVYGKGSWIMHMLRGRIGTANFLRLLGEMCRQFRNQPVSVAQFQKMAAAYLPKGSQDASLDLFFDHWVENTGVPTLTLTSTLTGKAPRQQLVITLTQTGVDEQAAIATPVEIQHSRTRTETLWLLTSSEPVNVTIALKARPLKVSLDPGGFVLKN
jgi:hypothetical protein